MDSNIPITGSYSYFLSMQEVYRSNASSTMCRDSDGRFRFGAAELGKHVFLLDDRGDFTHLRQIVIENKIGKRINEYMRYSWQRNTNCASMAEYLRYGRISRREMGRYNFLFGSMERLNYRHQFKTGDVLMSLLLNRDRDSSHEDYIRSESSRVADFRDRVYESNSSNCWISNSLRRHSYNIRSVLKDRVRSEFADDYHFLTYLGKYDGEDLFISQDGRNYGKDLGRIVAPEHTKFMISGLDSPCSNRSIVIDSFVSSLD